MELITKFKNYLLSQKDKPSDVTVKNYLADIKQFISWVESAYNAPFQPQNVSIQVINEFKTQKLPTLSASSIDRHISSLRKFFTFLKLDGQIASSPFDQLLSSNQAQTDPYHLRDFKNYLYIYNASRLTIKNYLIDVKQFLAWAETVLRLEDNWNVSEKNVLIHLNNDLVQEYKRRLIQNGAFSASSINRKLSSLRKYLSWAAEQDYLQASKVQNQEVRSNIDEIFAQSQFLSQSKDTRIQTGAADFTNNRVAYF